MGILYVTGRIRGIDLENQFESLKQLHIVYEDRLEIIAYVHDYFVNQATKLGGFSRH